MLALIPWKDYEEMSASFGGKRCTAVAVARLTGHRLRDATSGYEVGLIRLIRVAHEIGGGRACWLLAVVGTVGWGLRLLFSFFAKAT
jgi:hypothetical protein